MRIVSRTRYRRNVSRAGKVPIARKIAAETNKTAFKSKKVGSDLAKSVGVTGKVAVS